MVRSTRCSGFVTGAEVVDMIVWSLWSVVVVVVVVVVIVVVVVVVVFYSAAL